MEQKIIKEYIRALEHITKFMRTLLEEELIPPVELLDDHSRLLEITTLRMLTKSKKWPLAVPDELICGEDEDQKLARASGILNDFIQTDLSDKKLLDFGCGEGHVPFVAANLAGVKLAIGYDILKQWNTFEHTPNLKFSNDFEEISNNGPYDAILINDVIDHTDENILTKAKELLNFKGRIYLRCHPWTSRHGTHLYKQLNKAYLHLVFTSDELYSMGLKETPARKILDPIPEYKKLIEEAGLSITKENIISQPIEIFFTHEPSILKRIKEQWKKSNNEGFAAGTEFPREILEIQFVDFILV